MVSHALVATTSLAMVTITARPICALPTIHAMPMLIAPTWTSAHASPVSAATDSPVPTMTSVPPATTIVMPMPHAPTTTVDSHAHVTPVSMAMETHVPMWTSARRRRAMPMPLAPTAQGPWIISINIYHKYLPPNLSAFFRLYFWYV